MYKIPSNLQPILWSRSVDLLNIEKDKTYIIHQILAYGTWENIKWLFKNYDIDTIKETFSKSPEKNYSEKSYNFVKNILLEIDQDIDKAKYVKSFPRYIG